jgi:hypothetical protein
VEASAENKEGEKKEGEKKERFLSLSRLTAAEGVGMLFALIFGISLFLPWFQTDSENPNSIITSANPDIGPGQSASAWDAYPWVKWAFLAAVIAPFILAWIVARGHELGWKPGEVTMIVGITAFILVLCNGVILGKPEQKIEIGFSFGYPIALLASLGMAVCGFIRQAYYVDAKKPPGTI